MNGADSITPSAYNLLIGGVLLYGFIVNALIVFFGGEALVYYIADHYAGFIILYFILCFAGVFISARSTKPLVSFLGYNLVVVPIGAVVTVSVMGAYTADVLLAIIITGAITAIMTFLGATFPRTFAKMGRALLISLIVYIIVRTIAMLFGYTGGIFDWIASGIFTLYIAYDWQKAQMFPKTVDNAVDCALDLYLDIINLFLRILRILSRSRKN